MLSFIQVQVLRIEDQNIKTSMMEVLEEVQSIIGIEIDITVLESGIGFWGER